MVKLERVSKTFGDTRALHSIDLTIESRRTTAIIGPSGCGKSTLLRLINGLIYPDAGWLEVDGIALTPANALEMRRRMGYVIQEGGLFPHLTARRNVLLMAGYLDLDKERSERRLDELAELTKLSAELLDHYPAQLSGGERQRISLMRALMLDPGLLLLDEPLGALDPMIRADLQDDLREVFRSLEKTVVLVTHDLAEAAFFADTIVLLRAGAIAQVGTLADLRERPASEFVARFLQAQRFTPAAAEAAGAAERSVPS